MINTYFKLSFRALWRKKSFSLLNILGLAIGIGASLLIFLVIRYEMSYDDYQTKRDRIFRMVTTDRSRSNGEVVWQHSMIPEPLAKTLRQDFSSLEKVSAMQDIGEAQIYVPGKNLSDEKRFKERHGIYFTDPLLYDIFDFKWLDGNATGITAPNTVVLSQSLANNYFGSYANAMGKTILLWSYRIPLRVVGIYKDLPDNTDVPVKIGASYATYMKIRFNNVNGPDNEDWRGLSGNSQCFVLLPANQNIQTLQARMPAFVKTHYRQDEDKSTLVSSLTFQPLRELHLDTRFGTLRGDSLSPRELWALALIGIFLLLVACINFINLATAQSVTRSKEIGVRKVLGSDRGQLVQHFLYETALITLIALITGCILAAIALPSLSSLMNKQLTMDLLHIPSIPVFLVGTFIVVTLLAGFYPAMVLSGFNPVAAIKSKISAKTVGGISLRRGLVVCQFVIAQLLVIGTLVVVKQMNFFRSQSMGFQKDAIVLLDLPSDSTLKLKYTYLRTRMAAVPGVMAASLCGSEPSTRGGQYWDLYFNNSPERQPFSVKIMRGDTGYLNTFRMKLAAGRLPYASDTTRELLVNETLVKKLGLKSNNEIIGKMIAFDRSGKQSPVTGVLRDFNDNSLAEPIAPIVMGTDGAEYSTLALRLDPGHVNATLAKVQQVFTEVYPTYIYDCAFFDSRISHFYAAEAMTAQLFKIFAFLAIFISCLGLYGLVSFMAVQKTKEVGIRKVLGASVQHIVYLFSKEFTVLIGIAFLIAAPAGYYFMQKWLEGFHYHTHMGWGIFVLAIILSILVAWAAVGYKAIKAALTNPIKSLRSE
ncbi:FtsX-like permease family protein [Chitinophaga agrisoli]|uniref:FtsX-like permease family protein n=1 Tax=Chitinophaga agrisoli TaxID=2607653 RepID=A0A5B2VQS8_9BACT|nr:FtsX-like permease family protein [Chitinophaga agrisoli]KAA2240547.1 FtsX-like permease family protein [Chitinophaga agrisoli]